jgi:MaoC like domain
VSHQIGDAIPEWVMESVSPERMCTMAALLRDPNPIHWDREAVDKLPLGLGKRTINQGPLGLSYMINMLHAWMGPECIRRIVMTFPQLVLDNERVVAMGIIAALYDKDGLSLAECDIWLEKEGAGKLLEGTATVCLGSTMDKHG